MKSVLSNVAAVAAAFTTGFVAGILLAPRSGESTRQQITDNARERMKSAEKQLEALEAQLADLNEKVQEQGKDLSENLRKAAQEMIDTHLPNLSGSEGNWSEGGEDEVVKDLRRIKKK